MMGSMHDYLLDEEMKEYRKSYIKRIQEADKQAKEESEPDNVQDATKI